MIYTLERFSNKKIAIILAIESPRYMPGENKYWARMDDIKILYFHPHLGAKEARETTRFYQFTSKEMLNEKKLIEKVFKQ